MIFQPDRQSPCTSVCQAVKFKEQRFRNFRPRQIKVGRQRENFPSSFKIQLENRETAHVTNFGFWPSKRSALWTVRRGRWSSEIDDIFPRMRTSRGWMDDEMRAQASRSNHTDFLSHNSWISHHAQFPGFVLEIGKLFMRRLVRVCYWPKLVLMNIISSPHFLIKNRVCSVLSENERENAVKNPCATPVSPQNELAILVRASVLEPSAVKFDPSIMECASRYSCHENNRFMYKLVTDFWSIVLCRNRFALIQQDDVEKMKRT